ncbi:hypothetical protein AWB80_03807 [Caballeronia pedi]|uniref:Glycosyltransferase RgtA/B/C/D-like domain-containing protein n=1 Tax=Caballeronia pedi TaxID=1777141 RepID=A0A158BMQ3_9BURK|nr:hypothetical protein [Caballeronia pedi]SAK71335.1 hypothetical protein AWB80_03807 [Caballeronia pedi]
MVSGNKVEPFKKALVYSSIVICVLVFAAYLTIIGHSYFFQDDFYFWPRYSTLEFHHLFNPKGNFGRPVTRDLYFFLTSHILGKDPANFFYLNLAVIAGVCWFIYRTLREFSIDPYVAATAAAVYFYMAPTVPHALWISNSQHTVAHLFSFWFIALMIGGINAGKPRLVSAAIVFLLAVFSNVSSLFAVVFVGVYVLLRNHRTAIPQFGRLIVFLGALTSVTVAWSLAISHNAPVVYKLDLSLEHSLIGAQFYDELLRAGMIGRGYWLLFIAVIALVALNIRRTYLLTLPLLAAFGTAFGMLFFLSDQRTLGYMAIPYILFALMLFGNFAMPAFRAREIRSFALIGLSFVFVFYSIENGAPQRESFMDSPYGSGIRELQTAVKNVPITKDTAFCFAPSIPSPEEANTSPFWLVLGVGRAFWLIDYGDQYKRQFLFYKDAKCSMPDAVHVTVSKRNATLAVTSIQGPESAGFPARQLQGALEHSR